MGIITDQLQEVVDVSVETQELDEALLPVFQHFIYVCKWYLKKYMKHY